MSAAAAPRRSLAAYLRLVRFEHTLFALPFAYVGMLLAAGGWPGWRVFALITLAMVGARTFAMAMNRLLDAGIDARNPRTAGRELPSGQLKPRDAYLVAALGVAAFMIAGLSLNPLTAALLPVAALALALYALTKRFTWLCHAWLGATIGAAAAGGYIAVAGTFAPEAWWLWLAVGSWIAGFDVIYALLDRDVDLRERLNSVPARFGVDGAKRIAAGCHIVTLVALVVVGRIAGLGWPYGLACSMAGLLFLTQHLMLARRGPAAALQAFDANLIIGSLVLVGVVVDLLLPSG